LNKGGLIFPCNNASVHVDYSFILRSSSPSSGWTRIDIKDSDHLLQPTIIRFHNSQQLRVFFRDENAVWVYYSDSNDDGLTWTTSKPTSLPNNNAGIEAYTLKNGAIIMAFNNHNGTQQRRSPLIVALSYDNGMTWPYHDNDIHLVYTYDRKTIKYVRFNENWIKQGK
jgi:predicted neuraminidase